MALEQHELTLRFTVDTDDLRGHVEKTGGNQYPITVTVDDWNELDLEGAWNEGLLDEVEVTGYSFVGTVE